MAQRSSFSPLEDALASYTVPQPEEVQDFLEENSLVGHRPI
jgi:hypothetical protein